jgi:hypothetical protein
MDRTRRLRAPGENATTDLLCAPTNDAQALAMPRVDNPHAGSASPAGDSVSRAAEPIPPQPAAGLYLEPTPDSTFSSAPARDCHVSRNAVRVLLRIASAARLFRSADGRFYAQVPVGKRQEIYGLK